MSWNWNSLLLPISIPSPHPSSWWGCHCHQAQISQRLHNIRKILQHGISTRHRLLPPKPCLWMSMTSDILTPRQVGPDYTQELLEAAGVSRFPWRNEEVLLKHYIGNDPAPFLWRFVVVFLFAYDFSIKILQNGLGGILRLNLFSSIFGWHGNRCSVCMYWRRQYWKVLKPANILMCLVDGQITQRICCLVSSPLKASPKKCHLTKESLLSRYGEKLLISVTRMTCCGIQRCTDALISSTSNHKNKSLTQEEELYQNFKIFQHI